MQGPKELLGNQLQLLRNRLMWHSGVRKVLQTSQSRILLGSFHPLTHQTAWPTSGERPSLIVSDSGLLRLLTTFCRGVVMSQLSYNICSKLSLNQNTQDVTMALDSNECAIANLERFDDSLKADKDIERF